MEQLAAIVASERPDAMVVSGDVYHTSTPSNSVMAMFESAIDKIIAANPGMKVIVTAGNHDSGSRLEISRAPWKRLGVEMVGRVTRRDDGEVDFAKHIVVVPDRRNPRGVVVALPHIYSRSYPVTAPAESGDDVDLRHRFMVRLNEELRRTLADLGPVGAELPIVVSAHLAIAGSDTSGHDEIGGMEYVDISDFGLDFDYLALGHIHKRQTMGAGRGNAIAHYCGTPLAVTFAEDSVHGVSLVRLAARGECPEIAFLPIATPWPLRVVPPRGQPPFATFDDALVAIAAFDEKAYLAVRVMLSDVAPCGAIDRAQSAAKSSEVRFCKFLWERSADDRDCEVGPASLPDIESFKTLSPQEIATDYYRRLYDSEMPAELSDLFSEILAEIDVKE